MSGVPGGGVVAAAADRATGAWQVFADSAVAGVQGAATFGSPYGSKLARPVVGIGSTADGDGYWLVASDGGIFSYGDAHFYGSTGGVKLNKPIVGMAPTPDGHGYWLVASDGGIFSYGDAHYHGSLAGSGQSVVALVPSSGTDGYTLVTGSGSTADFGVVSSRAVDASGQHPGSSSTTPTQPPVGSISTTGPSPTATAAPPSTPATATPPGDLFGAFDSLLAANAPVSADSSALAADIVDQYKANYGTFGVQDQYPIVTVAVDQPGVDVGVASGCSSTFESNVGTVPLPDSAASMLSGSSDNPLIVWQPSTSTEWEFWQMSYTSGSWSACWGGKITGVSGAGGVFTEPYGLAASGVSYLATAITEQDIQSGAINHPIAVQLPLCTTPFVAPATRSDCGSNAGTPAEGMRFRFPATMAMPSGLTTFGQMVFLAIQKYGVYVTDHAGAVVLVAEDPSDWAADGNSGPDPLTASWQGQPEYGALNGMPWSGLQLVSD